MQNRNQFTMFEKFIEHDTEGKIKALTLEWQCPTCAGLNFKILLIQTTRDRRIPYPVQVLQSKIPGEIPGAGKNS